MRSVSISRGGSPCLTARRLCLAPARTYRWRNVYSKTLESRRKNFHLLCSALAGGLARQVAWPAPGGVDARPRPSGQGAVALEAQAGLGAERGGQLHAPAEQQGLDDQFE